MVKVHELNSLALAYVGDAVYELYVRHYLIEQGCFKPQQLHEAAVQFVSAPAQARLVKAWLQEDVLTKEERAVVRRGRNAKSHSIPKNIAVRDYKYATAFEALVGYLYLSGKKERLEALMRNALKMNEDQDEGEEKTDE